MRVWDESARGEDAFAVRLSRSVFTYRRQRVKRSSRRRGHGPPDAPLAVLNLRATVYSAAGHASRDPPCSRPARDPAGRSDAGPRPAGGDPRGGPGRSLRRARPRRRPPSSSSSCRPRRPRRSSSASTSTSRRTSPQLMAAESIAQIASEMEPDDRADLFSALPDAVGDQLLETLARVDPEAAEDVREIEKWPETSAGHLMTTSYVHVEPTRHRREAVDRRPRAREGDRRAGVQRVRRRLRAPPHRRHADQGSPRRARSRGQALHRLDRHFFTVHPEMDQEEVARRMAKYDLNAMPVVDGTSKVLLGICTIDDIVDVLTQEQTEDIQRLGAVEPLDVPYFATTFRTLHQEARRLAGHPLLRGVRHADRAPPLRPDHGGRQGRADLRPAAHLGRRQLRLAIVHPHHPRPHHRRDQGQGLVAGPHARSRPWAWCSA